MSTTPVRTRPRTILVVVLVAAALLLAGLALVDPTAAQSEPATTTTAPGTAAPTTVPPNMPAIPRAIQRASDERSATRASRVETKPPTEAGRRRNASEIRPSRRRKDRFATIASGFDSSSFSAAPYARSARSGAPSFSARLPM